jgi:putative peptidoglycan lipid II flippase
MPADVMALSVMTAMLPRLGRHAARVNRGQIAEDLSGSMRLTVVAVARPPPCSSLAHRSPSCLIGLRLRRHHGRSMPRLMCRLGTDVADDYRGRARHTRRGGVDRSEVNR